MISTTSWVTGLSDFFGRSTSTRTPLVSWRTPQSCNAAPVTLRMSPSPPRTSVSSRGSPWRMSNTARTVCACLSRVITSVCWIVVEWMTLSEAALPRRLASMVSRALPSSAPPLMEMLLASTLVSAAAARSSDAARNSVPTSSLGRMRFMEFGKAVWQGPSGEVSGACKKSVWSVGRASSPGKSVFYPRRTRRGAKGRPVYRMPRTTNEPQAP